ncbi:MAG: TetR/AcrR family transcriptional regulator [Myxococcaceae bacterium]|nr:TetR/AcrR family transcriptional regulator [Myxococcaceae bacterium]MCI0669870.1 TetR/AcrR family transcriptional regulator [Myxococcaceae bacterium]
MARTGKAAAEEAGARESERRKTILRAAIDVFAKKGYHGCRIADVAREAGVAYGLVYHYFKNKDELLQTVFDAGWGGFIARIREVVARDAHIVEKVHGVTQVAFEAYRVDPRGVKVIILEVARAPAGERINRQSAVGEAIQLANEMFERARDRGELRADLDPFVCAGMLFGALEMCLTALVLGLVDVQDEAMVERVQRQISDAFLGGILPTPSTGPAVDAEDAWKRDRSSTRSKTERRS